MRLMKYQILPGGAPRDHSTIWSTGRAGTGSGWARALMADALEIYAGFMDVPPTLLVRGLVALLAVGNVLRRLSGDADLAPAA